MSWISNNRRKILRRMVQLSVIFLLVSPLLGLKIFRGTLISGTLLGVQLTDPLAAIDFILATKAVYLPVLIGAVIVLAFYLLLGGRVFCGWVCPVYLLTEIVRKLHTKLHVFKYKPKSTTRYWILGTVLLLSLVTAKPVFETISPIGIVSRNIALGIDAPQGIFGSERAKEQTNNNNQYADNFAGTTSDSWRVLFNYSLWLLVILLLIDIFVSRGWWCRFICPVGTLYSLVGKLSPLKIKISHTACTKCGECFDACVPSEVLVKPVRGEETWIGSSCTNCLNCVDICPENALKISIKYIREK